MTTANSYQQRATQTRSRRRAAGKYPTPSQRMAFTILMQVGEKALDRDDLEALSCHPNLTVSQRQHFAALADKAAA